MGKYHRVDHPGAAISSFFCPASLWEALHSTLSRYMSRAGPAGVWRLTANIFSGQVHESLPGERLDRCTRGGIRDS